MNQSHRGRRRPQGGSARLPSLPVGSMRRVENVTPSPIPDFNLNTSVSAGLLARSGSGLHDPPSSNHRQQLKRVRRRAAAASRRGRGGLGRVGGRKGRVSSSELDETLEVPRVPSVRAVSFDTTSIEDELLEEASSLVIRSVLARESLVGRGGEDGERVRMATVDVCEALLTWSRRLLELGAVESDFPPPRFPFGDSDVVSTMLTSTPPPTGPFFLNPPLARALRAVHAEASGRDPSAIALLLGSNDREASEYIRHESLDLERLRVAHLVVFPQMNRKEELSTKKQYFEGEEDEEESAKRQYFEGEEEEEEEEESAKRQYFEGEEEEEEEEESAKRQYFEGESPKKQYSVPSEEEDEEEDQSGALPVLSPSMAVETGLALRGDMADTTLASAEPVLQADRRRVSERAKEELDWKRFEEEEEEEGEDDFVLKSEEPQGAVDRMKHFTEVAEVYKRGRAFHPLRQQRAFRRRRPASFHWDAFHAATTIASLVRGVQTRVRVSRFARRCHVGAREIQRLWRGMIGRREAAVELERVRAALCIQRILRGHFGRIRAWRRREHLIQTWSATEIQRIFRGWKGRARTMARRRLLRASDAALQSIQRISDRGLHLLADIPWPAPVVLTVLQTTALLLAPIVPDSLPECNVALNLQPPPKQTHTRTEAVAALQKWDHIRLDDQNDDQPQDHIHQGT